MMKQRTKNSLRIANKVGVLFIATVFLFTLTATTYAQSPQDKIFEDGSQPSTEEQLKSYAGRTAWYDPTATGGACNVSGSAAELLRQQPDLDPQWVDLIVKEAQVAGADPLAMASVLYWENRTFPPFAPKSAGSSTIGSGPWQIIAATWASHSSVLPPNERAYSNADIPEISTKVAADIVQSYGGTSGVPLGSVEQDFGKGPNGKPLNIPSIATFAKNYNAGQATWRAPGVAKHLQPGRVWHNGSRGDWAATFPPKPKIIDDYIVAVTYVYYKLANGEPLPKSGTDAGFFQEALNSQEKLKSFSFVDDGSGDQIGTVGAGCGGSNGTITQTALNLAWSTRGHGVACSESKPEYATVDGAGNPNGGALWQFNKQANHTDLCSDCGVFVSTVMRASGADPEYPPRGTQAQRPYLEQQTAAGKYQRIDLPTNPDTSLLRPGDILITYQGTGHTQIFVGPQTSPGDGGPTFSYNVASASLHDHVPEASNHYQQPGGQLFVAYRWLGN